MKPLEKELETKLRNKIKILGGRAYKFVSPGNAGVPDRLIVLPGARIYFVEMKRPGEVPRKLQERQMEFLQKLGFKTFVISTEQELENFVKEVK